MRKIWLMALALVAVSAVQASAVNLTYVDLVNRLTDLEGLAVLPEEGEICAQWSSWDRASQYDEATGKYVHWDANGDGGGIIRKEGDLSVMAEIEGPGCIWRIWSAAAHGGKVKMYLDGALVLDMPFQDYFDTKKAPFNFMALVHNTAKGLNNYVPIPFNKSCKIVAENGWGNYYHFTYSKFPKGTTVPTFNPNFSTEEIEALVRANHFLSNDLGKDPNRTRESRTDMESTAYAAPKSKSIITKLAGPKAITRIAMADLEKYSIKGLRNTILNIYWDGEKTPSVSVPVSDFFGTGPGLNKYKSLPLGVTDEWCYSYWYMPFAKEAVIELQNDGNTPFACRFSLSEAPLTKPVSELGRFHAKWHRDAYLPTEPERWIDWTMLTTKGRGRFVGVMLEVWNPRGGWWGEGDEKFHVDGEKFPSTFGTGSEDYFGYAWCDPSLFENCYHNQTISQGNAGHISVNRWHIADNVPFQKSFDAYIEKYFPNKKPTLYASTVYWYLEPGGIDPYTEMVVLADRIFYEQPEIAKVFGALEGEDMKVIESTGGNVGRQELFEGTDKWSGGSHLWWTNAKPGSKITLAVPVNSDGKYKLSAQFTKAGDYGIVQLYLDGKKIGEPIDLYNNGVVPSGVMQFGEIELATGERKLSAEIVGANEKADKRYMFGLDYIKLDKVD